MRWYEKALSLLLRARPVPAIRFKEASLSRLKEAVLEHLSSHVTNAIIIGGNTIVLYDDDGTLIAKMHFRDDDHVQVLLLKMKAAADAQGSLFS